MFASATRFLLRRAPLAVTAAGGASLVTATQSFPKLSHCDEAVGQKLSRTTSGSVRMLPRTTSGLNAKKPTVITMKTGLKFMDLYKAEHKDPTSGDINMSKELDLDSVSVLMEGSGGKKKQAKEMFNVVDDDHKGFLTYSSIVAYFLQHAEGTHNEKMAFLFHACDVEFKNKIEPHHLKVVVHLMMSMKMEVDGKDSFLQWHPVLYADIPERFIVHLKANEFVTDVFTNAHSHHGHDVSDHEELTEKEFIAWHARGGKQAKRLDSLFGIGHMSHH